MSKIILGVQLQERMKDATKFQSILSQYGCHISTRLGLHMAAPETCESSGIILLEFADGSEREAEKFEQEVMSLGQVTIKKMIFK